MQTERNEMENKLESVWSTELGEYFEERYGIDINEIICDEILKTIRNENKLGANWTPELAEYMYERHGIDICDMMCDEIQNDKEKLK